MKVYSLVILSVFSAFIFFGCEKKTPTAEKEVSISPATTVQVSESGAGKSAAYEAVSGGKTLPAPKSLDKVLLTEYIDFGCPHCYRFNSILPNIQDKFREKLTVTTYIMSWRGEDVAKAYYYAEMNGKGDMYKNIVFRLFHDSGIKNINNPEILKTVLSELNLLKDNTELAVLLSTPEVTEKYKEGEEKIRTHKIESTPTVVIEDAVKAEWSEENLSSLITSLLKE